jgi:hypothetical protein
VEGFRIASAKLSTTARTWGTSSEVDGGPAGGLGLREVVGEQGGVITQAVEHRRVELWSIGLHVKLEARILSADSDL